MNPNVIKLLKYLEFKGRCAAYQHANPVRLDYDLATSSIKTLEVQQDEHVEILKKVMPKVATKAEKTQPKKLYNKDGELSALAVKWYTFLNEQRLPPNTVGPVTYIKGMKEANPNSPAQVKDWLYSLGWSPCTFEYVKNKDTGEERKIPQVRKDGELTNSVKSLIPTAPDVEHLSNLTVIQHRVGVFKGFVKCAFIGEDGYHYIHAGVGGLTNTFRFKHRKPMVNLPGVDKPWGKEIRACFIAPDGYEIVGADVVSLESSTKRHYITPLDPTYAEEMGQHGFDEHLDLAMREGEVSEDDIAYYVACDESGDNGSSRYKKIKSVRKDYKPVNYGAMYGIKAVGLSRQTGMSIPRCAKLVEAYAKRNWSLEKIAEQQVTRSVGGYTWLRNPVSGFWHELRYQKDRFSTLNQSTGVYLFDSWLARCMAYGYQGIFQFHDETGGYSKIGQRDKTRRLLEMGVTKLNKDISLHVKIDIDVQFGRSYAEVH